MNIELSGQHVDITDALRSYTEEKIGKLSKHAHQITRAHINFTLDGPRQVAEANISIPGHTVHASAESSDMYKSIDLLEQKLIAQLDKIASKQSEHR